MSRFKRKSYKILHKIPEDFREKSRNSLQFLINNFVISFPKFTLILFFSRFNFAKILQRKVVFFSFLHPIFSISFHRVSCIFVTLFCEWVLANYLCLFCLQLSRVCSKKRHQLVMITVRAFCFYKSYVQWSLRPLVTHERLELSNDWLVFKVRNTHKIRIK